MSIRVLIIDDEKPAREKIKLLLKNQPDIDIIAESANGGEAVDHIRTLNPDLLFLDIQMPILDGFGVLETIDPGHLPVIIFVTAFDQYAIQAFEANAIDYLLKPYDESRFNRSLIKARHFLQPQFREELRKQLQHFLEHVNPVRPYRDRIVIKTDDGFILVKTCDIDWIEAAENYVNLHSGKETHLIRKTMKETEKQLDPDKFIRIHRSTIVNIEKIKHAKRWFNGEYQITLLNGMVLTSSRGYSQRIQSLFDPSS